MSCDSNEGSGRSPRTVPKVKNGKFEEGVQNWGIPADTTGKVLWHSSDVSNDGRSFVRFTLDSIGRAALMQRVPYVPRNYRELSVKAIARSELATGFARISVECTNENKGYNDRGGIGNLPWESKQIEGTSDWRNMEVAFIVPPETTLLRVFFEVRGEGYVDLSEVEISEAQSKPVPRVPGEFR